MKLYHQLTNKPTKEGYIREFEEAKPWLNRFREYLEKDIQSTIELITNTDDQIEMLKKVGELKTKRKILYLINEDEVL